ncbi:MAG: hypothetical protein ACKODW_06285, partial [Methylophilaceae bacterium]
MDGCDWDVGEFSGGGAKRPAFALTACSYSLVIPASHKRHSREGGNLVRLKKREAHIIVNNDVCLPWLYCVLVVLCWIPAFAGMTFMGCGNDEGL